MVTRVVNLHTWTLTGMRGKRVSNHSRRSRKCRHSSPIVMGLPPPALTSISCRFTMEKREGIHENGSKFTAWVMLFDQGMSTNE